MSAFVMVRFSFFSTVLSDWIGKLEGRSVERTPTPLTLTFQNAVASG